MSKRVFLGISKEHLADFFSFDKTPGLYDNTHLHISSICWRLIVSLLTEIQYLQIDPNE